MLGHTVPEPCYSVGVVLMPEALALPGDLLGVRDLRPHTPDLLNHSLHLNKVLRIHWPRTLSKK